MLTLAYAATLRTACVISLIPILRQRNLIGCCKMAHASRLRSTGEPDLLYSNIAIVRLGSGALAPARGIDMLVFSRLICGTGNRAEGTHTALAASTSTSPNIVIIAGAYAAHVRVRSEHVAQ